ncbi:MAG: glycosyltransferase family 2 protein [Micromonosporaceae bacterium]|nr:glycosyltransferase family 2 protein [Micromonosporaceae bacterium]
MEILLNFAALIPFLPILMFLVYGSLALVGLLCRRADNRLAMTADDLFFVFVVPCLNEELVIEASINRLRAIPGRNTAILVVDDGSDDATAAIVSRHVERDPRVRLLRRSAPHARQGKGAALNAAYRHLWSSGLAVGSGRDSDHIVVVVVDADGRLELDAPATVAPLLGDPRIAAVQVGVRMYNRNAGWLARMQDMEFLVFTEIYQRARRQHGNAGLGGNGQFVRLSALESLGVEPWTDYLTEDLDMGLRLQALGWRTSFTPATFVSQEGLTTLRPLMRQRTRWYQGHLQCWSRMADLLRCRDISGPRAVDLMVYLITPITVQLITLSLLGYLPGQAVIFTTQWDSFVGSLMANHALLLWWYLFIFSLTPLLGYIYWRAANRRVRDLSLPQAMLCGFLFTFYNYVWLPVGWRATWRLVRGQRTWAKTLRLAVQPPPEVHQSADEPLPAIHS